MKKTTLTLLGMLAVSLIMGQVALGQAGLVLSNTADQNPNTSGQRSTFGNTCDESAIAGTAWNIDCDAAETDFYISGWNPQWIADGNVLGLTWRARVLLENDQTDAHQMDIHVDLGNGNGKETWNIGWSRSGSDVTAEFMASFGSAFSHTITGGGGSYHTYEIFIDPNDGLADFLVDGVVEYANIAGEISGVERLLWGNSDGNAGSASYAFVQLVTPEPTSAVLLVFGALLFGARSRQRLGRNS